MTKFEGTDLGNGQLGPLVWINVTIPTFNIQKRTLALIDSGADKTTLPYEIFTGTPVDWADLIEANKGQGVGGRVFTRLIQGTVAHEGTTFINGDIHIMEPGKLPGILLGREDFFKTFKVDFQWEKTPPIFHVRPHQTPKANTRRKRRRKN